MSPKAEFSVGDSVETVGVVDSAARCGWAPARDLTDRSVDFFHYRGDGGHAATVTTRSDDHTFCGWTAIVQLSGGHARLTGALGAELLHR